MQELGTDLLLICSNVSPVSLGGIDRAADDFRELGELAARAWLARRIRGAGLGTACQRLPRRLGDRAARRPSCDRRHSRQFSRVGPVVSRPRSITSIPADKIFMVQLADAPKLDLDILSWSRHFRCFPGQGDLPLARVHRSGGGYRLRRPVVAGDLQRSVPCRLCRADCDRRLALADPAAGTARRQNAAGAAGGA